jgi:nucleoside-diphosphate-sugar epimerase
MRLFVTGGAGYIGSVFVREALKRGHDVTVLDIMYFGKESLRDVKRDINLIKKDLRKVTPDDVKGHDAIIDFAAMSNDPAGDLDPRLTYDINYKARTNLCRIGKESGIQRYVAPSSCAIYGSTDGVATEATTVNPLTDYAKANYMWENAILPMASDDYCVTVLRQSTVYGLSPKMRFDLLVNTFTRDVFLNHRIKIKGNGQEHRPFIHVKDDCNCFLKVLKADPKIVNRTIFNVGTDNVKVMDLVNKVADTLGVECSKEFGEWVDKRNYTVSFDRFNRALEFKPEYDIPYGIREIYGALKNGQTNPHDIRSITVEWYKYLIQHSARFKGSFHEYTNKRAKK